MAETARPQTARELRAALIQIFPSFAEEFTEDDLVERERMLIYNPHGAMQAFTAYFGAQQSTFTDKQLRALGALLNQAVEFDDELENAVATCFLEHLHQIRGYQALAPHLAQETKQRTRA